MKSKTVLHYLSTVSDSFLVVAFAVLVSTPFVLGIATRPVVAKAPIAANIITVASNPIETPKKVLGVSDVATPNPIIPLQQGNVFQNVNVSFSSSVDKKLSIDASSATSNQYSLSGTLKQAGTYTLLNFNNSNTSPITLNPSLTFTGSKASTYTVTIGTQVFKITKDNLTIPSFVLNGKSQSSISITTDNKNLDSFSLKIELKS